MRDSGKEISGLELSKYLDKYSEIKICFLSTKDYRAKFLNRF